MNKKREEERNEKRMGHAESSSRSRQVQNKQSGTEVAKERRRDETGVKGGKASRVARRDRWGEV